MHFLVRPPIDPDARPIVNVAARFGPAILYVSSRVYFASRFRAAVSKISSLITVHGSFLFTRFKAISHRVKLLPTRQNRRVEFLLERNVRELPSLPFPPSGSLARELHPDCPVIISALSNDASSAGCKSALYLLPKVAHDDLARAIPWIASFHILLRWRAWNSTLHRPCPFVFSSGAALRDTSAHALFANCADTSLSESVVARGRHAADVPFVLFRALSDGLRFRPPKRAKTRVEASGMKAVCEPSDSALCAIRKITERANVEIER